MTAGRRMSDSTTDTRRAVFGVVVWIAVLLGGYLLATEWQSLPTLASSLLTTLH